MFNHKLVDYECPYCQMAKGDFENRAYSIKDDIIYKDENVTAFVSPWWWKKNKGHVIIITNEHVENLYDLSNDFSVKIHKVEKMIALAMKEAYHCDAISTTQQNELWDGQIVWHYNLHIIPRYEGDQLFKSKRILAKTEERLICATLLRNFIH